MPGGAPTRLALGCHAPLTPCPAPTKRRRCTATFEAHQAGGAPAAQMQRRCLDPMAPAARARHRLTAGPAAEGKHPTRRCRRRTGGAPHSPPPNRRQRPAEAAAADSPRVAQDIDGGDRGLERLQPLGRRHRPHPEANTFARARMFLKGQVSAEGKNSRSRQPEPQ